MNKKIASLFFISLIWSGLSSAQSTIFHHAGKFKIEKEVEVSLLGDRSAFLLKTDPSDLSIKLGCNVGITYIEWPRLKELINGIQMYNFAGSPNISHEVSKLQQQDFYCDMFTGKDRDAVFKVAARLGEKNGQKLKLKIEGMLTVTFINRQRVETLSFIKLEFYQHSILIAKLFRGYQDDVSAVLSTAVGFEELRF